VDFERTPMDDGSGRGKHGPRGHDDYSVRIDPSLRWIIAFASAVILAIVALVLIGAFRPETGDVVQTAISGTLGIAGGVVTYATIRGRTPR
jgi:hypothetical protein